MVSELFKPRPNIGVIRWMAATPQTSLYLSVLTLGELRKGIEAMERGARKTKLVQFLERDLQSQFTGRILDVDAAVTQRWGVLEALAGRTLPTVDALLAATALTHHLTLVTRNTGDFKFGELKLLNPWTSADVTA